MQRLQMDSSLSPLCLHSGMIQCGMCKRKLGPWGARRLGAGNVLRNLKFHTTEMSTGETEIQEKSKMRNQLEKGGGEVQEKKYTHHHHTLAFKFFFHAGADEQQHQPLLIFTCSE